MSRPIENPFGPTPKVAEEKVESPFADTPKAAEPAPVVRLTQRRKLQVAEPVENGACRRDAGIGADIVDRIARAGRCRGVGAGRIRAGKDVRTGGNRGSRSARSAAAAAGCSASRAVALKEEALKPMLDTAGLVWVNTDADKLRAAREAAAQAEAPKRVVRERKRLPPLDAAPMQQVETGKTHTRTLNASDVSKSAT